MSEEAINARLAAVFLALGMVRTWANPPGEAIPAEECPCAYPLVGPTLEPVNASRGTAETTRIFVVRVLVMPMQAGLDDPVLGNEATVRATPIFRTVRMYVLARPLLSTAALPPLAGVLNRTAIADGGLSVKPGPGGGQYAAIDFSITIGFKERIPSVSIPYNS